MSGSIFPFILVLMIIICVAVGIKRYKASKETNGMVSNRKNKGEVWKTVKQYMKDNGQFGQEIIETDVRKRIHFNYLDPSLNRFERTNKRAEMRLRRFLYDHDGLLSKAASLRDLYVVTYQAKDSKSGFIYPPQCFECEVISTKPTRKTPGERKIVITGRKNYAQEMKWIGIIRQAEKIQYEKTQQKQELLEQRKKEKEQKRRKRQEEKTRQKNAPKI